MDGYFYSKMWAATDGYGETFRGVAVVRHQPDIDRIECQAETNTEPPWAVLAVILDDLGLHDHAKVAMEQGKNEAAFVGVHVEDWHTGPWWRPHHKGKIIGRG